MLDQEGARSQDHLCLVGCVVVCLFCLQDATSQVPTDCQHL